MPPFFIITILLIVQLPSEYKHYSFLVVIIFWVVLKSWDFYSKIKNEVKEENSSKK
ncbi:hypothetical protein SAMN06295926_11545 [Lysinibacillus sp. AC-3]|nr:hypothetical protein SAMN06295926_11545 [Lysinibacillus sp. AC-3]